MTEKEKIYILKHTPEGFTLSRDGESDRMVADDGSTDVPELSMLTPPRWSHWYQRKLARPWQATLLGMNIEPISKARRILKARDADRFNDFRDRLDILQTLMGIEIGLYENHVREGEGANERYIELAEYCKFAEGLGWANMEEMHNGLRLNNDPPVLKQNKRQENNLLHVLDSFFLCAVPNYLNKNRERSPAAVLKWFSDQKTELIVSEPTLRNWFQQLVDLKNEETRKENQSE